MAADQIFDELIVEIGEAGRRLSELGSSEGGAGNISILFEETLLPPSPYHQQDLINLPVHVPELAGKTIFVTGSGCRLRDLPINPERNLGIVIIREGGHEAMLYTAANRCFQRLSTEFNSHLAVHRVRSMLDPVRVHALAHAQPPYLTYLSHVPRYQEESALNRRLLRWQPELIMQFPHGIGFLPFAIPGSLELMQATAEAMQTKTVVVWAKHGVIARANDSVLTAVDLIEYAEAGAHYEYMDICSTEGAEGLTIDDILDICSAYGIEQTVYKKRRPGHPVS